MNSLVIINLTLLGWMWPFSGGDADKDKTTADAICKTHYDLPSTIDRLAGVI